MSASPSPGTTMVGMESPRLGSAKKTGRPPNEAYIKLMGPDEDWRQMADGAERRKIQNRLAQRAYRRNLREKNKEVEKLKRKLQKAEGSRSRSRSSSGSSASMNGSCHENESYRSESLGASDRSMRHSVTGEHLESDTSDDLSFMLQDFSADVDDLDSEFMPSVDDMDFEESIIGSNPSHTSAASAPSFSSPPNYRGRSSSPFFDSSKREIFPHSIGADFSADIQTFLAEPTHPSADMGGMTSGSIDQNFPLSFTTPFQSPFMQCPMDSSFQDSPSLNPLHDPESPLNPLGIEIPTTKADSHWSPDGNASLLHFAVAGGDVETLKLLLQHQPISLNVQDSEGYTAMQRAVMLGRTDMVAVLLEFCANNQR